MIKEFILICIIMCILWVVLSKLIAKISRVNIRQWIPAMIIIVAILVNVVYNTVRFFPDTWLSTVGGDYKYGTFTGNMLTFSDDFMYQEEMLFPLLKNRTVYLDSKALYCKKFFETYSKSVEMVDLAERVKIGPAYNYDYIFEFEALDQMSYTWDENMTDDIKANFEEDKFPKIFLNMAELAESDSIVVAADEYNNLYFSASRRQIK